MTQAVMKPETGRIMISHAVHMVNKKVADCEKVGAEQCSIIPGSPFSSKGLPVPLYQVSSTITPDILPDGFTLRRLRI